MAGKSAIEKALDKALAKAKTASRPLDLATTRYVIFSDQHKGQRDGADDFARCEWAYIGALKYYDRKGYTLVVLGDVEELWECRPKPVMRSYGNIMELERRFHPDRYLRVYGNHDDEWESPRRVRKHLWEFFPDLEVSEAFCFDVRDGEKNLGVLFMVHGHQGEFFSDQLAGIAKFAVRTVWRFIQRLTRAPSTTPAKDACLREKHDKAMYDWAAKQDRLVMIAGHTHRPVFSSKTHLQQLLGELQELEGLPPAERPAGYEKKVSDLKKDLEYVRRKDRQCEQEAGNDRSSPCYFNTGCCSFGDGDITGLEIADGELRLVRWPDKNGSLKPLVLARSSLAKVFGKVR